MRKVLMGLLLLASFTIMFGCSDSNDGMPSGGIDAGTPLDSTWKSLYETSGATGFYLKQTGTVPTRVEAVKWNGTFGYVELTCGRFGFDISSYPDAAFWATQSIMVEYDRDSLTCASHKCSTSNVNIVAGIVEADFTCTLN